MDQLLYGLVGFFPRTSLARMPKRVETTPHLSSFPSQTTMDGPSSTRSWVDTSTISPINWAYEYDMNMIRSVWPFIQISIPPCSISERRFEHSFETKRKRTWFTCRHSLRLSTFCAMSNVIFAVIIIISHLHCMSIFYNVKIVWSSTRTLVVKCVTTRLWQSSYDDIYF